MNYLHTYFSRNIQIQPMPRIGNLGLSGYRSYLSRMIGRAVDAIRIGRQKVSDVVNDQ